MTREAPQEATWQALQRDLERDARPLGRLRALRTSARVALAASAALAPALVAAARHPEAAHATHALLAVLVLASAALLLAPLGRPRHHARRIAIASIAALIPLTCALIFSEAASHNGTEDPSALRCFAFGAGWATPAIVAAQLLSRTALRNATELALLAALSGIGASLLLDLHCASRHAVHLVLGHASIGLAWTAACSFLASKLSRRSSIA